MGKVGETNNKKISFELLIKTEIVRSIITVSKYRGYRDQNFSFTSKRTITPKEVMTWLKVQGDNSSNTLGRIQILYFSI